MGDFSRYNAGELQNFFWLCFGSSVVGSPALVQLPLTPGQTHRTTPIPSVYFPLDSCYSPHSPSISPPSDAIARPAHPVVIRTAIRQDVRALADVLTDSFHPPEGLMFWVQPFLRLGIYEDLRARLRANTPQYHCFTATLGATGLIIGTVEIAVRPLYWGAYQVDYPYISNLAVHPDYRRRGVARQLLLSCEPKALEWGFQAIYLHVLDQNRPARKLYKSLGYYTEERWPASSFTLWPSQRLLLYKTLNAQPV